MNAEQVKHLNAYQANELFHPLTCGSGNRKDERHLDGEGVLVATENGWHCPFCDYKQAFSRLDEAILKMDVHVTRKQLLEVLEAINGEHVERKSP